MSAMTLLTDSSHLPCGVCGRSATTYSTLRGLLCIDHMLASPEHPNHALPKGAR